MSGHGNMSLVLRNAVPAIEQGFWPDSISTDLHGESMNKPLIDMPTLLSKFLTLGMPLKEVMLRATWNPAQMIHHPELGHLTAGAVADVAVWRLMEGHFGYADAYGGKIDGRERLFCEMTLRAGAGGVELERARRSGLQEAGSELRHPRGDRPDYPAEVGVWHRPTKPSQSPHLFHAGGLQVCQTLETGGQPMLTLYRAAHLLS